MPPNNSDDLFEQITNTPDGQLTEAFIKTEKINIDEEIEKREKVDGYKLRKFFNQAMQKALLCLPYISWVILGVCAFCICVILISGTGYIIWNEERLFNILENAIWGSLISLATCTVNNLRKKK